jgi:EAL domain-containing protein (putative c-di-GMP-specific phosphodiesterase class I)
VQMAHNFGVLATAVGISESADLQMLREFDCDIGQGYLLGNPMEMQEIDKLITKFKSESAHSDQSPSAS